MPPTGKEKARIGVIVATAPPIIEIFLYCKKRYNLLCGV